MSTPTAPAVITLRPMLHSSVAAMYGGTEMTNAYVVEGILDIFSADFSSINLSTYDAVYSKIVHTRGSYQIATVLTDYIFITMGLHAVFLEAKARS